MIRNVRIEDLDRCFEIESIAYSGDEAASKEKIAKRIHTYPQGFIVKEDKGEVVGFINSGACHQVSMSDHEFKEMIGHDPNGKHLVIMSVVVHPQYQKLGYARSLMEEFIIRMTQLQKQDIFLMCQTELIEMYAGFGFKYVGESKSDHGGLSWHEMVLALN